MTGERRYSNTCKSKIYLFQSFDFYFVQEDIDHQIVCFFIGGFSKSTLLYYSQIEECQI